MWTEPPPAMSNRTTTQSPNLGGNKSSDMLARLNFVRPAVALCLVLVASCTTETRQGDTTVFAFALWIPALVLLVGLLAFVIGLILRRRAAGYSWPLMIMGLSACVILVPGLFLDGATINQDRFTLHTGLWFAPVAHEVHFKELTSIELTRETTRSGQGTNTTEYIVCNFKSGGSEKIPVGDLMRSGPTARTLQVARKQGIPVIDNW
jgi:hypothetical protein